MTLFQCVAFATVARQLNITKAAQELRTSQPSLSRQLKNLEETYKIKLFLSNHKGIQLTDDGVEFLRYVEPILEQFRLLEARFSKSRQTKLDKRLRIGGSFALCANYLPSILKTFNKRYPQVEVILRSNGTNLLEKMLVAGAVEIVFTSVPTQSPDLTAEPCMRMKLIAFAAKGYPLPLGRTLTLKQLENTPLIIRNGGTSCGITETLLKQLQRQGYKPKILMRCESPEAIRTAVSKKLGVGILYEDVVKDGIARGVFKRINLLDLPRESIGYIVLHKNRPLSSTAQAFLSLVREGCTIGQEQKNSGRLPHNNDVSSEHLLVER